MTPLADVFQLSDWIGEPIEEEADKARAELALRFASALVRQETQRTWLDSTDALDAPLPEAVVLVTLASAARGYTNPEGIVDESLDDWRARRPEDAAGFALTEAEKAMLRPYAGRQHGGLGTVSTIRGDLLPDHYEDRIVHPSDIEHRWGRRT